MSAPFLLLLSLAAANDVIVVDRGGGAERTAAATAALATAMPGAVALPVTEVKDLDAQHIAPCMTSDDACLVRAMATIDVIGIVFVEPTAVAVIDLTRRRLRRVPASTTAAVAAALDEALNPATTPTAPPATPTPPPPPPATTAPPPPATTAPPTTSPAAGQPGTLATVGLVTTVVGASLGVGGSAAVILGELYAVDVIKGLQRGEARGAELDGWEAVQLAGVTAAAIGVIAVAGGVTLMVMEPPP